MYSTCLFCNQSLGTNSIFESFPIGRRLAFDAAKGRLWVVCRKCERWNLSPLDERWETIEQAELHYAETRRRVEAERRHLVAVRSRPVMADPSAMLEVRRGELDALRDRARHRVLAAVHRASDQVGHLRAQVRALSPQSTLERGYAVVQHRDGRVVLDQAEVGVEELLRVGVGGGDFGVRVAAPS